MTPKQEARLYSRAIKERWDVPSEMKSEVLEILLDTARNDEKGSTKVSACKAIMDAEGQNQRDEHKVVDVGVATRHDQMDAIARDLDLDPALIADVTGKADPSIKDAAIDAGDDWDD